MSYRAYPSRSAVPNKCTRPLSNKHTTAAEGQIHTNGLTKYQKIVKKLRNLSDIWVTVWPLHMCNLSLPCKQSSMWLLHHTCIYVYAYTCVPLGCRSASKLYYLN